MSEREIRFLVENFYDVQKLRIEAFNRVVAYAKSQYKFEPPMKTASQPSVENNSGDASLSRNEPHTSVASPSINGDHCTTASFECPESHRTCASLNLDENHRSLAAAFNISAAEAAKYKKPSQLALAFVTSKLKPPPEISNLVWYHNMLHQTEKELAKRLNAWSKLHKLRIFFLSRVQGIGPILSSGLIAWLDPISRFSNPSKLWKYCGLAPGQHRIAHQKCNYNPRLKTFMWKIATSFEKQKAEKAYYRRIYDKRKLYYQNRSDFFESKEKGVKGHIRNLTLLRVSKQFLLDMWLEWRRMEGLPVTMPYAIGILEHTEFEPWQPDRPAAGDSPS